MKRIFRPLVVICMLGCCAGCENRRTPEVNFEIPESSDSLVNEKMSTPADGTEVDPDIVSDTNEITTGNPPVPLFKADSNFAARALSSGLLEIQLGELAQTKATSKAIRQFGRQVVEAHSSINAGLKALCLKKKWEPVKYLLATDRQTYKRLADTNSHQFERDFPTQMVLEHERTIALFEQANRRTADADLRAFTSKTLPSLRMHLDMARALQKQLKNE